MRLYATIAFYAVLSGVAAVGTDWEAPFTGEWYNGSVSILQRQNTATGQLAPPTGNNMFYKFMPDGSYQQYGMARFTYSMCSNTYFMNITGRWERNGNELTLTPVDGTFESRTCGGEPVRKPTTKVVSVFQVKIAGDQMVMTDAKGASSTYRRK